MQEERFTENNSVKLAGTVAEECTFSHKVFSEGFYTFKLRIPRLSENEDILPVTVSERLIDVEKLKEGVNVELKGQLRSYNYYSENKNRLVLTVFAREIEILEDETVRGMNEIEINGFICKEPVYRKTPFGREITDILVAANRSYNKSDYIPVITWGRNARYAGELSVGDNILISGRIQSRIYRKKIEEEIEERTAYEVSVSKIERVEKDRNGEPSEDSPYNEELQNEESSYSQDFSYEEKVSEDFNPEETASDESKDEF